jgi:protein-tyrosine phosphatase
MAEGIFNDKIRKLGLQDKLSSDSAGTSRYHISAQPDERTLDTLKDHGISHQHAARQAISADADHFDYIIAMDRSNFEDLKSILPDEYKGLHLMREFDQEKRNADVPDPYFGGLSGFEDVYSILDRSMDELITFIRTEKGV